MRKPFDPPSEAGACACGTDLDPFFEAPARALEWHARRLPKAGSPLHGDGNEQGAQGLRPPTSSAHADDVRALATPSAPSELRVRRLEPFVPLVRDLFAVRCAPLLSSVPSSPWHPLEGACSTGWGTGAGPAVRTAAPRAPGRSGIFARMPPPPSTPLLRALERLAGLLSTKQAARRWYEAYLHAVGPDVLVDTCNDGQITWVHRRAAGSRDLLPLPAVEWTTAQSPSRLLEGLVLHDGRQYVQLLYDADGRVAESARDERYPGRLVELGRVIAGASDPFAATVAFVAGLSEAHAGPGRVHCPQPVPGGVRCVWRVGLLACRRALHEGRVPDEARFLVADGLEGTAVGWGATREEAEARYAAAVARALPERRFTVETATDDYDDDGQLIARGELPPGFAEPGPPGPARALVEPEPDDGEAWKAGAEEPAPTPGLTGELDPDGGRIAWGPFTLRGPSSDAPDPPRRADAVPHVRIPLDPPRADAPPRGRWVRLLGETGVTRHALRIEERDGFLLVGADLLGLIDLSRLRADLDAVELPQCVGLRAPELERYVRFRCWQYRWSPATEHRPEGLAWASGASGPRFEAGSLDGDTLQAMVHRHRRVPRPAT